MSLYRRGEVWWYKFRFNGQLVRESARTNSKTLARQAEQSRRRELELAVNRIPKRDRMPLFSLAAQEWLRGKMTLAPKSLERYRQCVQILLTHFGNRLVCDFDARDIAEYQRRRLSAGVSNRTVNYEVGTLRGILRHFGLWGSLADRVRSLPENHDVGRAVSQEDEKGLMCAAQQSRSPALLPLLILSEDTGLRASEVRALRHRDVKIFPAGANVARSEVVVPKSKTPAGTGRTMPLTQRASAVLAMWLSCFPNARPESFLFPRHKVGMGGNSRSPRIWAVDLSRPMGSWKKAWARACKVAGVRYRWHDLRHTFVSRLAENPNVSEQTIRALAGHVSERMLERYSHIRRHAKDAAITALERVSVTVEPLVGFEEHTIQNEPTPPPTGHNIGHSPDTHDREAEVKSLEKNGGPTRTRTWDQRIMSPPL